MIILCRPVEREKRLCSKFFTQLATFPLAWIYFFGQADQPNDLFLISREFVVLVEFVEGGELERRLGNFNMNMQ